MKPSFQRFAFFAILGVLAITIGTFRSFADSASAQSTERHRLINQNTPGQTIDIAKFVVPGKINIFDFYSKYCPPCMRIGPMLEKLAEKRTDIVVNKVDINRPNVEGIDWQSPLARQYKLESIPHFVLYDANGKKIAEGENAAQKVIAMLQEIEKQ